jgi:formate/nitrite transporter FocA (FNT family)
VSEAGAAEDVESTRPSAAEVLGRVIRDAEDEISRPVVALAISGFAAGLLMGLTPTAVAAIGAALHSGHGWREVVAFLGYPLGFAAVILGRAQLFTENTLYPVVLVLDRRKHLLATLRLWLVVLLANMFGVLVYATIAARTPALPAPLAEHVVSLGENALRGSWGTHFWTGVIGGWLIALVAWLVEATGDSIAHLGIIWALTFIVGIGHFAHSIATAAEILTAVVNGDARVTSFLSWATAAVLGNTIGGVVIVALLNYGQVTAGREAE